jgi:hypothetical protein
MAAKTFLYKVYKNDVYQGNLANVVSDFEYNQDINSAGAEINVEIGATLEDAGASVDSSALIIDGGTGVLITENNDNILINKDYLFSGIPLDLGNRLDVWLYYSGAVNGVKVFSGLISSWESDLKRNSLKLTALSWGAKLDDYLIQSVGGSTIVEQVLSTATITMGDPSSGVYDYVSQSFTAASNTTLSSIQLRIKSNGGDVPLVLELEQGDTNAGQTGVFLGQVSRSLSNTTMDWVDFNFSVPMTITSGTKYTLTLFNGLLGSPYTFDVGTDSTGSYTGGTAVANLGGGVALAVDLAFRALSNQSAIGVAYNSTDPGLIIRDMMKNFAALGGKVTYSTSTVDTTGTTVSYAFKFNTVLEGIKKCLELAPANWYWYVDIGSSTLHFHQRSATANHTLTVGQHIENLVLKYTLEDMKNTAYITGGEVAGVNLLVQESNASSIGQYGQWLYKESDNRILRADTAAIIGTGVINQDGSPVFRTTVEVPSVVYDIETFSMGQMVTFRNAGDLANGLLLQIVGIQKTPDKVTLKLDSQLATVSHRVEDIRRNLDMVMTINNPDSL